MSRRKTSSEPDRKGSRKRARRTAKSDGPKIQEIDPPIIVGGGGSTLVWLRKETYSQVMNPQPTTYVPRPDLYDCFRVIYNCVGIYVGDGENPYVYHPTREAMKHNTIFSKN